MRLLPITLPQFKIEVPLIGTFLFSVCTVGEYKQLKMQDSVRQIFEKLASTENLPDSMLHSSIEIWRIKYIEAVESYIESQKDCLCVPTDGSVGEEKCMFPVLTMEEKMFCDYTGLNFLQMNEINYIDYRLIVADAAKLNVIKNKTDGIKYLNSCYGYMFDRFSLDSEADDSERIKL